MKPKIKNYPTFGKLTPISQVQLATYLLFQSLHIFVFILCHKLDFWHFYFIFFRF